MIRTTAPRLTSENSRARWTVQVQGSVAETLWFDVPADVKNFLSPRADAALVALLLPAMRTGQDLHLGGTVTDELLRWVNEHQQELMCAALYGYRRVGVTADNVSPPHGRADGVAMGFSAGVDSFAALEQCYFDPTHPAHMRVTHLLFNNVGSHGDHEPAARALFLRRLSRVEEVAKKIGLPLVDVDSNVHGHFDLFPRYTHVAFANTHTMRNASVAHVLAEGIGRWYYASSAHLNTIQVRKATEHLSVVDGINLPLLSTTQLGLSVANMAETRVAKTRRIADSDLAQKYLNVCIEAQGDSSNCSSCSKCMRTQTALDMIGKLDDFDGVFDRSIYESRRRKFATKVHLSHLKIDEELIYLADETGWEWPRGTRRRARLRRGRSSSRRIVRLVARKLTV